MVLRLDAFLSAIFLAGCSSNTINYSQNNSRIVPVNSVVSCNNPCIDHFNFLGQAGDDQYQNMPATTLKSGMAPTS